MIGHVFIAVVLSQYVRSKADDTDPNSACLYWKENTQIVVHQNTKGNPETNGAEFTAMDAAIATWQAQQTACGSLSLVDGVRTDSRLITFDAKTGATNENVILFRLRACSDVVPAGDACRTDENGDCGNAYDCWDHQEGAIALTTTTYNPSSGFIYDSDIEFNTPNFLFTTVDAPQCPIGANGKPAYSSSCVVTDIQNTATHELGHLMGLGHIAIATSTMNASARGGELSKRSLDDGTKQFVCDVYPAGKPARSCVLPPVEDTLGKAAKGCGCGSGPDVLAFLGVGALLRRRRRAA